MAGADVANVCSVLLREGVERLTSLLKETDELLDILGVESVASLRGSLSLENYAEPAAFERASYIKLLQGYKRI
jgi:dihydroorotate dehydrogenase (fumarate)